MSKQGAPSAPGGVVFLPLQYPHSQLHSSGGQQHAFPRPAFGGHQQHQGGLHGHGVVMQHGHPLAHAHSAPVAHSHGHAPSTSSPTLVALAKSAAATSNALASSVDEDGMLPLDEDGEDATGSPFAAPTGAWEEWHKLDISNMKITTLSPRVILYHQLTELYLQGNALTRLPLPLFRDPGLPNLRVLDLSANQIHWLQPEIAYLLQLRYLNLAWNMIRELPMEIGKLFRLEELALDGNPLVKPSADVIERGARFVTAYFRDRMPGPISTSKLRPLPFRFPSFFLLPPQPATRRRIAIGQLLRPQQRQLLATRQCVSFVTTSWPSLTP